MDTETLAKTVETGLCAVLVAAIAVQQFRKRNGNGHTGHDEVILERLAGLVRAVDHVADKLGMVDKDLGLFVSAVEKSATHRQEVFLCAVEVQSDRIDKLERRLSAGGGAA